MNAFTHAELEVDRVDFYIPNEAIPATIYNTVALPNHDDEESIIPLDFLTNWLNSESSQDFCALLGDAGIGKTTTCKKLIERLLKNNSDNNVSDEIIPIYIDLREYIWTDQLSISLEDILQQVLARSENYLADDIKLKPSDILYLNRNRKVLFVFDNLDEVLVHMPSSTATSFTKKIISLISSENTKLLVCCRKQYFRNLQEQNSLFFNANKKRYNQSYATLTLLPFTKNQVKSYIHRHNLGDIKTIDPIISSIGNDYELLDIARNPYMLSLMSNCLPVLYKHFAVTSKVSRTFLYRTIVDFWLNTDQAKNSFIERHKIRILEYLAAVIWRKHQRRWSFEQLENFVDDFIDENRKLFDMYRNTSRETLYKDVRTMPFIVRTAYENFRFSHSSIQEYFIACFLFRGLNEGRRSCWEMDIPSVEILDFLVQLLVENQDSRLECDENISKWLEVYEKKSSKFIFYFWMLMAKNKHPLNRPEIISLENEDLSNWNFTGSSSSYLDLQGVNFNKCNLIGSSFEFVDLTNTTFHQTILTSAKFLQCILYSTGFNKANLKFGTFRNCEMTLLDLRNCLMDDMQLIFNRELDCIFPTKLPSSLRLVGHSNKDLYKIAVKPDGDNLSPRYVFDLNNNINCITYTRNNEFIAAGYQNGKIRIWNPESEDLVLTLEGHTQAIRVLEYNNLGNLLVSGSDDSNIKLWDTATGECLKVFRAHQAAVYIVKFTLNGNGLVSVSKDSTVRAWNVSLAELVKTTKVNQGTVYEVFVSTENNVYIYSYDKKSIKVLDFNSGEQVFTIREPRNITYLKPLDKNKIAICIENKDIRIIDLNLNSELTIEVDQPPLYWLSFSDDRHVLAVAFENGGFKVWNISKGKTMGGIGLNGARSQSIALRPDGDLLAFSSEGGKINIWDVVKQKRIKTMQLVQESLSFVFCNTENFLITGTYSGMLGIWDIETGKCVNYFKAHKSTISSLSFESDSQIIISGCVDGEVKLWDLKTGNCTKKNSSDRGEIRAITFIQESFLFVACLEYSMTIRDGNNPNFFVELDGHQGSIHSVEFSPCGEYLVSGAEDRTVRVWEVLTGKCVHILSGHTSWITTVSFSNDSRFIASGSNDNTARIWSAETGRCLKTLEGHTDAIYTTSFDSRCSLLSTGSDDETIKIWNIKNGKCIKTFIGHKSWVGSTSFNSNGTYLISGSGDSTVKIWDINREQCLKTFIYLPNCNVAVIDELENKFIFSTNDAWRWIAYGETTKDGFDGNVWPAEVFGALPIINCAHSFIIGNEAQSFKT